LAAHCHLGLGTLYARVGELAQAHLEVDAAREAYVALDMQFWRARAERELALLEQIESRGV
jgi:hypothetical protein